MCSEAIQRHLYVEGSLPATTLYLYCSLEGTGTQTKLSLYVEGSLPATTLYLYCSLDLHINQHSMLSLLLNFSIGELVSTYILHTTGCNCYSMKQGGLSAVQIAMLPAPLKVSFLCFALLSGYVSIPHGSNFSD
jgi:hypothetical protein